MEVLFVEEEDMETTGCESDAKEDGGGGMAVVGIALIVFLSIIESITRSAVVELEYSTAKGSSL